MNQLHPLSAVSKAVSGAMSGLFVPVTIVVLLADSVEAVEFSWLLVIGPLGVLAGLGYGIAWYYRFGYELTRDTFDVDSGVFARQSREIPYGRIQNVDVRQNLLHRLLGVAVVSIETAGGGDTEATLRFVSDDEAERVRTEIRRLTAAADSDDDRSAPDERSTSTAEPADPKPFGVDAATDERSRASAPESASVDRQRLFALEPRELLLYAATAVRGSAGVLPVIGLLYLADSGSGLVPDPLGGLPVLVLAATAVLPWAIATAALSAVFTVTQYYGFRLDRVGDDFVYERGLIERYSGSIPVEKVQSVTITDNPLQRLLGYAGLWVETAGYGPESDGGSQSAVPFAEEGRVYRFVEGVTGLERPAFEGLPTVARRRYLARYSMLAALLVAVAFVGAQWTALERWYLAALAFVAVPPAAHLKWTHRGYYVGENHLVLRRGFWRRRTTVIPYYRIQTVTTRRSLFQRRLGLASVVVDTASSRTFALSAPTIDDVDLEDARAIHERGREGLQRTLRERARDDGVGLSAEVA